MVTKGLLNETECERDVLQNSLKETRQALKALEKQKLVMNRTAIENDNRIRSIFILIAV